MSDHVTTPPPVPRKARSRKVQTLTPPPIPFEARQPVAHAAEPPLVSQDDGRPRGAQALRDALDLPSRRDLEELEQRLRHSRTDAETVGEVIAEAVSAREAKDDALSEALGPTLERSLMRSVKTSPKPLVDALFPVMGPAIRKAIAESMRAMIQAMNQALEHSMTLRGLKWRFDAWRTGRPFAEVVLLHTLRYRVEQVFFIHRDSGILLHHVTQGNEETRDPDLVSCMLTAIGDFVHDSFESGEDESLETLRVGDLNVWVEVGPFGVLAAVIRGEAPERLRSKLQGALAAAHSLCHAELLGFDGRAEPFAVVGGELEACLETGYYELGSTSLSPLVRLLILLCLLILTIVGWRALVAWNEYLQMRAFYAVVDRLTEEPGLVVVRAERSDERYRLVGLADPLAADPALLVGSTGLDTAGLEMSWSPYVALEPPLVILRAIHVLRPPDSVTIELDGTTLVAAGEAHPDWIARAEVMWPALPGVEAWDDAMLEPLQLGDPLRDELEELRRRVSGTRVHFRFGRSTLDLDGRHRVGELAGHIRRILEIADQLEEPVLVRLVGRADSRGSPARNLEISRLRARAVLDQLVQSGIDRARLEAVALGASRARELTADEEDQAGERAVSFEVIDLEGTDSPKD